ncbi:hypothetical protein U1Q18_004612 [Sarracenia purpurea var. burkii]
MAFRYEVEVTVTSAKDLKNVNWRYGRLKPYAVVWVDPNNKLTTRVDEEGDVFPYWDQKLVIPLNAPIEDSTLHIDIVHASAGGSDIKPLIGSARLPLRDVADEAGLSERATRKLDLKRPSGRPHGKVDIKVAVRDLRYRAPDPYYTQPYGVPADSRNYSSRDYTAPAPYANPYAAPPPPNPYQAAPPAGYPYGQPQPAYGQPQPAYGQPQPAYGQSLAYGQSQAYGQPQPTYGEPAYGKGSYGQPAQPVYGQEKKSKFGGMGTGLAVGAVAGVLGGLALVEGADYVEDKIADNVAEKVEDNRDDDDYGGDYGGDDDY